MNRIGQLAVLVAMAKQYRKTYFIESLHAIVWVLLLTGFLFFFHLYPRIHNIPLLYVLIIGVLALKYGHLVALVAAITASACLDYFFVPPLYNLAISQPDEVLSFLVFLVIALIAGFGCAESYRRYHRTCVNLDLEKQKSSQQTAQQEYQFHILYEMVEAINREQSFKHQLSIIAQAIVENFGAFGVHGCIILLPDKENKPSLQVGWPPSADVTKLLLDESMLGAAIYVMTNKATVKLDVESPFIRNRQGGYLRRIVTDTLHSGYSSHYASLRPISLAHGKVGVLLLLMEEKKDRHVPTTREFFLEDGEPNLQTEFFWRIKQHIVSVVEAARLQHEELELKISEREEELHANLIQWVSHGLRTPLTTIKLDAAQASEVLHEREPSYDKICEALEGIEHAANRLDHFVDDLLDMTRSKGGRLKPRKTFCYIYDLVDEALEEMKSLVCDRSVKVNVPDLPLLELDPIHIKHVLTNLLENAIRYTPADSPIEINAQMDDACVRVDVADRGLGIRPEDQRHLFDPFYQGNGGSRLGKGLGLAVCQALVEAHEGHIWVESRESGGTIFRFTLPLLKTEGGADE